MHIFRGLTKTLRLKTETKTHNQELVKDNLLGRDNNQNKLFNCNI